MRLNQDGLQKIRIDPERQSHIDLVRNERIRVKGHDLKFDVNDDTQGMFLPDR
jgi:hypothetical protein